MKIKQFFTLAIAAGISATSIAETTFNIEIENKATLNYDVASTPQVAVVSEIAKFRVDRKVIFNLTQETTGVVANVGIGTQQTIEYTLTNNSNAPIRFVPRAIDLASTTTAYSGAAVDNTDTPKETEYKVWAEKTNAGFNASDDTNITDGLGYVELLQDASVTLYVVTTPTVGDNNDIFVHNLKVTATEPASSSETTGIATDVMITQTTGGWVANSVQTVLDDTTANNFPDNGASRTDNGAIQVSSAVLEIIKVATVAWDPINGTTDPVAIPGAVIEYTITVTNTGAIKATNVAVTDTLPSQLDLTALPAAYTDTNSQFTLNTSPDTPTVAGQLVTFLPQDVTEAGGADPSFTVTIAATVK